MRHFDLLGGIVKLRNLKLKHTYVFPSVCSLMVSGMEVHKIIRNSLNQQGLLPVRILTMIHL